VVWGDASSSAVCDVSGTKNDVSAAKVAEVDPAPVACEAIDLARGRELERDERGAGSAAPLRKEDDTVPVANVSVKQPAAMRRLC
jgi:hypothetical protein